ncbi:UNVERIFIED_CONTAM: hypothetical protein NCL1_37463, partial [Trichonephila clavipes]
LANLALFTNKTKTRLLFICHKRTRGFATIPIVRVERSLRHCSCKGKYFPCEFSFLFQ